MPDRKIRSTDWPYSLLDNVVFENDEGDIFEGTPDQIDGLQYALSTLYERENKVLLMRYRDGKTLDDAASACNVTRERVRQIESKALRKLRHPQRLRYILNGLYGEEKRIATEKLGKARAAAEALAKAEAEQKEIAPKMAITLEDMDLSVRSYNCLKRDGAATVADLLKMDAERFYKVRNLGRKSAEEITNKLHDMGLYGGWEAENAPE